jgi:predicted membrane protein (TIGR00267 family)
LGSSESEEPSDREGFSDAIHSRFDKIGEYLQVTRSKGILRRYFVMNAFDGAMTSLGVVIGSYVTSISDPRTVIGVILVSGVAMAVSGFSGTYMTESAERARSLNELEDSMLIDLEETMYGRASRFVSVFAAVVDGSAPFIASIPCMIPFIIAVLGLLEIHLAFYTSVTASLLVLFTLGVFLGKLSEKHALFSGLKMVVAGVFVALVALFLGGH